MIFITTTSQIQKFIPPQQSINNKWLPSTQSKENRANRDTNIFLKAAVESKICFFGEFSRI